MHITRVEIKNFQCHAELSLAFGAGLNAIVGESDRGKTAVLRAIRWVLFNQPDGQAFRKDGTHQTCVALEFDNGLRITRTRAKTVNRYELERPGEPPVVLDNFGKDVPPEVLHATGVRPAEFRREGFSVELSFGGQFAPPFLLTDSGLVRAQVLGYLSRTTILDTAAKTLNSEIRQIGTEITSDEKERDRFRDEVRRYDDLEQMGERITVLDAGVAGLEEIDKRMIAGATIARRVHELNQSAAASQRQLARLETLPNLGALEVSLDGLERGERLAASVERVGVELSTARTQLQRVETAADIDVATLRTLGEQYERAADLNRRAQAWKAAYLSECEKLEATEAGLRRVTDELIAVLREMGACPTCFSPLDEGALANVQTQLREGV